MNYVVQSVVAGLFQSSEGLCQPCLRQGSLELATTKCQGCNEDLCDLCDHDCQVIAENLTRMLIQDVEQLLSSRTSLESALSLIGSLKEVYKKHLADLRRLNDITPVRTELKNLPTFTRTNLDAVKQIVSRSSNSGSINHTQLDNIFQDVGTLLAHIIYRLDVDELLLQGLISEIREFESNTNEIISSGSTSNDDRDEIHRIHDDVSTLLRKPTVKDYQQITLSGTNEQLYCLLHAFLHCVSKKTAPFLFLQ